MAVSNAFEELTAVLKFLERNGVDLQDVSVEEHGGDAGSDLAATLQMDVPLLSECSFGDDVVVRAGGTDLTAEKLTLDVTVSVPTDDDAIVRPEADSAGSTGTSELLRQSDRDVPLYKDPDALGRVYEEYDTFTEMTEALDVDVTAETVRRYMVEFDIHDPHDDPTPGSRESDPTAGTRETDSSADTRESDHTGGGASTAESSMTNPASTAGESGISEPSAVESGIRDDAASTDGGTLLEAHASADSMADGGSDSSGEVEGETTSETGPDVADVPVVDAITAGGEADHATDGLGLPRSITLGEFVDVLEAARTPHEAANDLEIDDDDCRRLLDELHLQDFVNSRISSTMAHVTPRVLCRRLGVAPEEL